jgi:hypothetical protein
MTDPQDHRQTEPAPLTPEQEAARKRRNVWIFWALIGFIVLIFVTTVVRLTRNVATGGA